MRVPLLPPPGLVSDDTEFSTRGFYSDGNNVRFWRGKWQVIGGWSIAHSTALSGTCRNILAWRDLSALENIAFGTHSHLQVIVSGELFDITPSGLSSGAIDTAAGTGFGAGTYSRDGYGEAAITDYYCRTWSLANWGENLLAVARGGPLYIWENNTASLATEVTQSPDQITAMLMTPTRQVMAFGCNEEVSGTFNPLCIRFSDQEDYTSWTTTTSNLAGEVILDGSGKLTAARMIGDYVGVWTDTAVYLGQATGDYIQPWRFDLVAKNCGVAGPNAVSVFNQTAFWLTPDGQFYSWQVGTPPVPMNCPINSDFRDNIDQTQIDKVVSCPISKFGEIWFLYPDSRDGNENSRYIAVSTIDGTWFKGELARTAAIDSGPTTEPMMVDTSSYAYWHETGQSANGGAIEWSVTTSDQYLGEADSRVLIRGIWPDFEDQVGPVNLLVRMRAYPQADKREYGPWALPANGSKKDFLIDGRIADVTFYGQSAPAYARCGKPSFDVVMTGRQ